MVVKSLYIMKKFLKKLFIFCLYLGLGGALIGVVLGVMYYYQKIDPILPDVRALKDYKPSIISKLYDNKEDLVTVFYLEKRIWLDGKDIPAKIKEATIAVEDSNFYQHGGIDFLGILRAAITNFMAGYVKQGGSTITQQLSKTFFLTPERTIERKLKEVFISFDIEKNFTKEEIIELYLNQIYYGAGAYGIEAAARTYFGKTVATLDLAEIATLVAIPKAPTHYSPFKNKRKSLDRRRHVLKRMVETGYISKRDAKKYGKKRIELIDLVKESNNAPYFIEHVRRDITTRFGTDKLYREGLHIYTTLDQRLQNVARNSLKRGLREVDKRIGYRGVNMPQEKWEENPIPGVLQVIEATVQAVDRNKAEVLLYESIPAVLPLKNAKWARIPDPEKPWYNERIQNLTTVLKVGDKIAVSVSDDAQRPLEVRLEQEPLVEGGIISIDIPNGEVKTMVGGYDFNRSQFNRAVQAKRQIGSGFKPIIYAAALAKGYSPASVIVDAPVIINGWRPENYGKKFYGPTLLRDALAHSRNVVTVKLLQEIGIKYVIDFARSLAITDNINKDLSIALGSTNISLLDATNVYATFARNGKYKKPIFIRYMKNRDGKIIEDNREQEEVQVIEAETAYMITSMLKSVVQQGTARRIRDLGHNLAGKTGTTNDYIDAWFLGYSPDIATGSWVGFDNTKPLGKGEAGSRAALPIWKSYMKEALKEVKSRDFPLADGLVFRYTDKKNGLLADFDNKSAYMEIFKAGTGPQEYSTEKTETTVEGLH